MFGVSVNKTLVAIWHLCQVERKLILKRYEFYSCLVEITQYQFLTELKGVVEWVHGLFLFTLF